jgi:hypothetical protein
MWKMATTIVKIKAEYKCVLEKRSFFFGITNCKLVA